ncbi:FAD-binding oxidoreductase [Georgenia yuyongxinii]
MTTSASALSEVERLRDVLDGTIVLPADADYDAVRTIVSGAFDDRPAVVVRAASVDDVVRTVRLSRHTGLDLAVRSGGHSNAGHGSVQGGVVLDLRLMKDLHIDAAARTATAQAGLTAAEYTLATSEHGLATGFGDTGSVGLGGLVTGGGVGLLSRKHGLTVDSLLAAQVVTAGGEVLEVDQTRHPELFWAIRGGGGNFGVVTRFTLRLHPVREFVGGILVQPATPSTVTQFLQQAAAAPRELTTILNVMPCPPLPMVPAQTHGRLALVSLVAWAGPVEEGTGVIDRLRAIAPPVADLVRPGPYISIFPPEAADYHPVAAARTLFLDHVDQPLAARLLERLEASDASMRAVQLRVLGGAITDRTAGATAYAHRAAPMMANVAAFVDRPEQRDAREAWVDEVSAALDQGVPGAYVNFLGREGADRVRAAYPDATWDRLRRVKAAYDPTNLFHVNHNVPAASA